jgi:hypothetical protein
MKLRPVSFFFAASLLSVASLTGCAADTAADATDGEGGSEEVAESEDAIKSGPSNFGYFVVTKRDFRRCISPLCGGWWVKRVNQPTTQCADGTFQEECYVATIQLSGIGLSTREETEFRGAVETGKALIKAKTYKSKFNGHTIGTLKANEGWLGATGSTPDGSFYRVADNGIRCITAPCPSTSAYTLNGNDSHNLVKVQLENTATPADQATLDAAAQAIGTKDGILIAGGIALPKCLPTATKCGPFATASEFYLRVTRREGKGCGFWSGLSCNAGQYCNWKAEDICGAADAAGVCSYKPQICNKLFKPVCACDGKTYGNACMAAAAGASVSSQGACAN